LYIAVIQSPEDFEITDTIEMVRLHLFVMLVNQTLATRLSILVSVNKVDLC